jgi:hypothetical protein
MEHAARDIETDEERKARSREDDYHEAPREQGRTRKSATAFVGALHKPSAFPVRSLFERCGQDLGKGTWYLDGPAMVKLMKQAMPELTERQLDDAVHGIRNHYKGFSVYYSEFMRDVSDFAEALAKNKNNAGGLDRKEIRSAITDYASVLIDRMSKDIVAQGGEAPSRLERVAIWAGLKVATPKAVELILRLIDQDHNGAISPGEMKALEDEVAASKT